MQERKREYVIHVAKISISNGNVVGSVLLSYLHGNDGRDGKQRHQLHIEHIRGAEEPQQTDFR
jgi:hypothetical protein